MSSRPILSVISAFLIAITLTFSMSANATQFKVWLSEIKEEAIAKGFERHIVSTALSDVTLIDRVIELDRRQPEGRLSFVEYRDRVVSTARIAKGSRLLEKHQKLLAAIEHRYGVPAEVIVALWGIESSFGEYRGRFPVVGSLASLAYDGRRAEFFKGELMAALEILNRGDITHEAMYGSWAGAMGQSQFMPSTYLTYAVDANNDGRRDIWNDLEDTFASMANYLSAMGWNEAYIWGRRVQAPASVKRESIGLKAEFPLSTWQDRGVRRTNGQNLPVVPINAALLVMDDGEGPSYLVYDNFRVVMRWNRSTYFATSVGLLSDALRVSR